MSPKRNLEQARKAQALRALHSGPKPLLLPNVWDVASARIIEESGFPAVATTSAGIAFAHGLPDGEKIQPDRMMAAVEAIAQSVTVPVTADLEAGYGNTPESVFSIAGELIAAGAVGMNFEDATGDATRPLVDLTLQVEKIRAIREAAERLGVPLVLNARTDVYLLQVGDPAKRHDETLRRLRAFRDAGADCAFVPGLSDASTIRRLVSDVHCPINILAGPGSLSVGELTVLGVRRISLGSGPMRASLGLLRRIADELKKSGTYAAMEGAPSHAEINALMKSNRKKEN